MQSADVKAWLQGWQKQTGPVATARSSWAETVAQPIWWIGNLMREKDRMAACSYIVSEDVLHCEVAKTKMSAGQKRRQEVSTGSVLMFGKRPSEVGVTAAPRDENILSYARVYDA